MAASSTAAALSRTSRLRTGFSRGLDASLAACTADDFCDSFATLGASNRDDLRSLYLQAQAQARENATVNGAHAFASLAVALGAHCIVS